MSGINGLTLQPETVNMKRVDAEEMKQVEEEAAENGISEAELMSNAGYQIADFVRKKLSAEKVLVYAGAGNNGGDALNAARRLANWGYTVAIELKSENLEGLAGKQLRSLENTETVEPENITPDAVIDGLVGYGLKGGPREELAEMIRDFNSRQGVKVSIDVPTGFDTSEETMKRPHVEPDHVLSLGYPKKGLEDISREWVLDIGLPDGKYFNQESIVKVE